jgi:hypothetical protein
MGISIGTLMLALSAGSALIALWCVVRFPNAGPATIPAAAANVVVAFVGGTMAVPLLIKAGTALPFPGEFELAVLSVLLPIVYLFISIAWFVRSMQALLAPYL